jgi:GABA(A) receptor-associated protein
MDIFKNLTSLDKRRAECNRIITKHPERIPVVVCKGHNDIDLPDIDKHKFLVPKDMTIGQFVYIIRKRIKLDSNHPTNKSLDDIYMDHKDEDGYLYIIYSSENTFG